MDPLTFAQSVSSERDPELGSWAYRYLETSAIQTLRAARYVEAAGDETVVHDYRTALKMSLERLPDEVQLEVSQGLFEALARIAGPELKALLSSRVKTAI
jgi:hypothetical protein